ncbi:hypothetical protein [Microcystis phage Mel-JY34]
MILTSLYVGTRRICQRPEPSFQREDQRRSFSYICQLCGDVWARELHPLAPATWASIHSVCPRHQHYSAGSFLYMPFDSTDWQLHSNFRRFPKELLLYELSLPCHTFE